MTAESVSSGQPAFPRSADAAWRWLDSLPEGVLVLDPSLTVWYANVAGAALLGLPAAGLLGRSFLQELAGAAPGWLTVAQHVLETGGPSETEEQLGSRCWQVRGRLVPEGVLLLFTDETARRQLEDELIHAAWHSRMVLEQLPTIHWIVNSQLLVTHSTGAGLARIGLTPNGFVGRTLYEALQTDDPNHEPIRMHLRALNGETVRYADEFRGRFYEVALEPFREPGGSVGGVIGLALDVTERRQIEVERAQLQQQFYQAQKLESLGLLASGIAHDFGNLQVGIQTAIELLLRDLPGDSPQRPLAELIHQGSQRAAEVTRQMLTFAGRKAPARRPLDLNQMIRDNLALFSSAFSRQVQLCPRLELDLPVVADPGQIQQVIMNLIINAAEAIGQGPQGRHTAGTIEVRTSSVLVGPGPAEPAGLAPGCYACLEVSDTGCGMAPEVQARIFEPFFTTKSTGRGLGLSAVRGILEGHGGTMRVRSQAGQGTTFQVYLPSGEPATHVARPAGVQPDYVLYIEDESYLRDVVRKTLEAEGVSALLASSGEEALELFRRHQSAIKLVVLDLVMPGLSGWDTLRALWQICPEVKVVLASATWTSRNPMTGPAFRLSASCPSPIV